MAYLKWGFWGLVVLVLGSFLDYTLIRQDIVRIVGSDVRRVEIGGISGMFYAGSDAIGQSGSNRDVMFIRAVRENGRERVYRNEDTGWAWPPYFKFNSADVQARAADLASTSSAPRWIRVEYYGWRSNIFSVFPNAVRLTAVEGPNDRAFPWLNVIVFGSLAIVVGGIWLWARRFWRKRVDPVVADVSGVFETAREKTEPQRAEFRGGFQRMREWWIETFGSR